MGELPIQNRGKPVAVDDHVADAEVAVGDGASGGRGSVAFEPGQRELEGREDPVGGVEFGTPSGQRIVLG